MHTSKHAKLAPVQRCVCMMCSCIEYALHKASVLESGTAVNREFIVGNYN